MALRLLIILALVIQPLALGAGSWSCRAARDGAGEECCQVVASCCSGLPQRPVEIHHCGKSAELCACGARQEQEPAPLPATTRTAETLLAILPRALLVALLPEPQRQMSISPARTTDLLSGRELRSYLCVWLT